MGGLRWLGRALGGALLVALMLLALAPAAASVLDRGPRGEVRASPLPLALVLFDPATWQAARNSSAVAAVVALGSMVLGVGLGLLASGRRSWGRGGLVALGIAPLALGPIVVAPGLVMVLGGVDGWDWLAARSILGASCEDLARWVMLGWLGLGSGVPLVILATTGAVARLEPGWADAARAVGASRWRTWREVTWPILRPDVARAAASAFAASLLEPAGPSILGLRRTLAVQVLEGAHRLDQPTRPAALALLASGIAALAWLALRRWGGMAVDRALPEPGPSPPSVGRGPGLASALLLMAWAAAALGPGLLALGRSLQSARSEDAGGWSGLILGLCIDPEVRGWARNAAGSAALALAVDLLILAAIAGRGSKGVLRRLVVPFEVVPPLALAVGALATPWLIAALADHSGPKVDPWLRAIAAELSPSKGPGWLLALALAAAGLPMLARAADLAGARARPALADAARALGLKPRRARRAGDPRWLGIVPGRAAVLAFALASTGLAPALLLAPTPETRTLAAAAFGLVRDSGPGAIDPHAAGPLAILAALRLVGLVAASTGRSIPLGRWFRG